MRATGNNRIRDHVTLADFKYMKRAKQIKWEVEEFIVVSWWRASIHAIPCQNRQCSARRKTRTGTKH